MSKKNETTVRPPTVITITLPDEGSLPRAGQILVQRGTLAIIRQFAYSSLDDISAAIQQAAIGLIQLEQDPPDVKPAADARTQPEPAADLPESGTAADDVDAEAGAGNTDEAGDESAGEQLPPGAPGGQMSLM